jgi:protease-4
MKKGLPFLSLVWAVFLSGCAFNFSLFPSTEPFKEKVLEGEGEKKVLLMDLSGTLSFSEEVGGSYLKKGVPKVANFVEALRKAERDDKVAGLVIRVNSPGGTVASSDVLYHEIKRFREKKKVPVYAHIMELGASGAYYASCGAERIYISPAAVTGSIGVLAMKFNVQGLMGKIGVEDEVYKSAQMKDFWSPFRPSTPEEKAMMQGIIDSLYGRFLGVVYEGRKQVLSKDEVKSLADGRVFTARDALRLKLVDGVQYLEETIEEVKKAQALKEAKVVVYYRPGTYKSNIYSELSGPVSQFGASQAGLLEVAARELELLGEVKFLYMWNP